MNMLKEFWQEEEGLGTVEIILIIAALVTIALIFRNAIIEFVQRVLGSIFDPANDPSVTAPPSPT